MLGVLLWRPRPRIHPPDAALARSKPMPCRPPCRALPGFALCTPLRRRQ